MLDRLKSFFRALPARAEESAVQADDPHVAAAALMNGGKLIQPSFLPRTEAQAMAAGEQVLQPQLE